MTTASFHCSDTKSLPKQRLNRLNKNALLLRGRMSFHCERCQSPLLCCAGEWCWRSVHRVKCQRSVDWGSESPSWLAAPVWDFRRLEGMQGDRSKTGRGTCDIFPPGKRARCQTEAKPGTERAWAYRHWLNERMRVYLGAVDRDLTGLSSL